MAADGTSFTLTHLSSVSPVASSRAWLTAPHPYLPLIATASSDKTVRIQSLTNFTLLTTLTGGHKRSVRTCAWKPCAKGDAESILATGSFDANAGIWRASNVRSTDAATNGQIRSTEGAEEEDEEDDDWFRFAVILEGHDSEIKSISWSCNGTFLATCSRDKSIWVWEALDSAPGGAISAAGRLGQTNPEDDEDNYETVAVLQEHEGDVKCVAFHPTEETCLASGSYDENIRIWREDLDQEWSCVGLCEGHDGTVWNVVWEPPAQTGGLANGGAIRDSSQDEQEWSGPRILSCSDDLTCRLWRRKPKQNQTTSSTGPRMPSIIRTVGDEEDWYECGRLPQRHERAVFAVSWSNKTKRVVSGGGDGRIVVYEEAPVTDDTVMSNTQEAANTNGDGDEAAGHTKESTAWRVIAEIEAAHGVFEVNHVCWAKRHDNARRNDDEEVIISTGDDGEVKIWTLDALS